MPHSPQEKEKQRLCKFLCNLWLHLLWKELVNRTMLFPPFQEWVRTQCGMYEMRNTPNQHSNGFEFFGSRCSTTIKCVQNGRILWHTLDARTEKCFLGRRRKTHSVYKRGYLGALVRHNRKNSVAGMTTNVSDPPSTQVCHKVIANALLAPFENLLSSVHFRWDSFKYIQGHMLQKS